MIIKIFQVSTKQMYTFRNKMEFYNFVRQVVKYPVFYNATIAQLIKYLPQEEYCQIK